MRRVVVRAEHPSGRKHLDGRFFLLHHSDLSGTRLRAKQQIVRQIEGVLHVARRVICGRVERGEVVIFRLDLRPLEHLEPHARKDVDEQIFHARDGVQRPLFSAAAGHGDVHLFLFEARGELPLAETLLDRRDALFDGAPQFVDLRAERGPLALGQFPELFIQCADPSRFSQERHLRLVQRMAVAGGGELFRRFLQDLFQ